MQLIGIFWIFDGKGKKEQIGKYILNFEICIQYFWVFNLGLGDNFVQQFGIVCLDKEVDVVMR